jgi:ubiquinone/menaquinone biosynthesis C-methylase UbiE
MATTIDLWSTFIREVFKELYRITKPNGWVAFEVGEIQKKKLQLDEYVTPIGIDAGFECSGIVVNLQKFTKTSNIWGISNNLNGTNSNRIVVFQKN